MYAAMTVPLTQSNLLKKVSHTHVNFYSAQQKPKSNPTDIMARYLAVVITITVACQYQWNTAVVEWPE